MPQSPSSLAEALANKPKPALATLPPTAGPRLVQGQPQTIDPGMFGGGLGGGAPGNPAMQYGPGGLVGRAMVTGLLSGNLPWLKPIPQLQGRVDMRDLRSLRDDLKGKK